MFFWCLVCPQTTIFVGQSRFWKKVPDFVPGFLGETLIGQKWCTMSCAQFEDNKTKALKPLFFCSNLALVVQQPKPDVTQKPKKESLIVHIGVLDVLNKVLFQKLTGHVSKKALFFCRFLRFFCICFQNPYFLVLTFPSVGFEFLLFHKSSCYVLVSVFCCFGFLGLLVCYVLCFFWFVFGFFCFLFLGGLRVR